MPTPSFDLTRCERLHTPPTLAQPRTRTATHTHPLHRGGSSESSHLSLYWNNRAVGMEEQGCPPTRTAGLPGQKHNTREGTQRNLLLYVGFVLPQAWTQTPLQRDSWGFFKKPENKIQDEWGKTSKPPYFPWDILVQRERTSLMHRSGVTNDMPAQYHPSRTKGQRSYFHSKQARTSSHLKREEKRAEGNHSFSKRRSLFHPQFPPYPKCKGHQNSLSGLKGEVRVCVYGGNKSKLQGIARRAVMSSWRGNNRNAHWTGFVQ